MATEYATTDQLNEFMVMKGEVPNPSSVGDTRLVEDVGPGDNTETIFFLDYGNVIADTYTLYYGATAEASLATPLTETTHYTFDKKLAKISLTVAGVALVALNNIYAAYSYNTVGFSDADLQTVLDRMEEWIDKKTSNHWAEGTAATPDYLQLLDEKKTGQGHFKRDYFTAQRPLPDVSTTLDEAIVIGDTTITVVSTAGFPETGYLGVGKEKIVYSAKDATTFTVTATTIAHADESEVLPYVFEASSTIEGSTPTWTVLEKNKDYDLDLETGKVRLMANDLNITDAQAYDLNPPLRTPNRFRNSYIWGNDEVPGDITQLCLMLASQELLHRAVRKAHANGMNNFEPSMINIDRQWIDAVIKSYKNVRVGTTV